ncbi:molybdopterin-guanine dinucleotide biosynthesis protein MobB [Draconibacterium halophilum]|uniref:Molybdopterin-guanine dinucleotide biosynthesis protein MobB n=1 Tax=Draconibacterium halophilum TaxID=2706887 RepID=A0A6C0RD45_9BACT|nr:molybdopterin-guanine dinucleotide biosynthesis protein MobB [Draconibacterium halophilum]QIA07822.1 molybdopterin-guanine dinucleotide biosynthesis protein MobB [Draconibacterium halophilum]
MTLVKQDTKIDYPNLLLIAGNGRNVGKTYFACRIIESLSKQTPITGLKITSHIHEHNSEDVLQKDKHYVILQEKQITSKDSSLMLQAGAKQVFFVMAAPEYLIEAFEKLSAYLPETPIVCESGGLHEIINPGLFFFVQSPGNMVKKPHHLIHNPIIVYNDGENLKFDYSKIQVNNNKFSLIS